MGKAKLLGGEGIPRSKDSLVFEAYGKEEIKQGNFVDSTLNSSAFVPLTSKVVLQGTPYRLVSCHNSKYICSAKITNSYMHFYVFNDLGTNLISQTVIQTGVDPDATMYKIRKIIKATEDTIIVVTNSYIIKVYITEKGLSKAFEPYYYTPKVSLFFGNAIADTEHVYILTWVVSSSDTSRVILYKFSLENLENVTSVQLYESSFDGLGNESNYYTVSTTLTWMSDTALFVSGVWALKTKSFLVDTSGSMQVLMSNAKSALSQAANLVAQIDPETIISIRNQEVALFKVTSTELTLLKTFDMGIIHYPTCYSKLYVRSLNKPNTYSMFLSGTNTSPSIGDDYSSSLSYAVTLLLQKQADGSFTIEGDTKWLTTFGDYSWETLTGEVTSEKMYAISFYKDEGFVQVPSRMKATLDFSLKYSFGQVAIFNSSTFCVTDTQKKFYVYTVNDDCSVSKPIITTLPEGITGSINPINNFNKDEIIAHIGTTNYLVTLQSDKSLKFQKLDSKSIFFRIYSIDSNRFLGIKDSSGSTNIFLYELNRSSWTLTENKVTLPESFAQSASSAFTKVKDGMLLYNSSSGVYLLKILSDNSINSTIVSPSIYPADIIRTSRKSFVIISRTTNSCKLIFDDDLENIEQFVPYTHEQITTNYAGLLSSYYKRSEVSGSPYSCLHFWNSNSNDTTYINRVTLLNSFINTVTFVKYNYNWGANCIPISLSRSKILVILSDNKSVAVADLSNVLIRGNSALTLNKATPTKKGKVLISGGIENDSFTYDEYE